MIMEVEFVKERRGLTRFTGVAKVDGEIVCTATMMCARSKPAAPAESVVVKPDVVKPDVVNPVVKES